MLATVLSPYFQDDAALSHVTLRPGHVRVSVPADGRRIAFSGERISDTRVRRKVQTLDPFKHTHTPNQRNSVSLSLSLSSFLCLSLSLCLLIPGLLPSRCRCLFAALYFICSCDEARRSRWQGEGEARHHAAAEVVPCTHPRPLTVSAFQDTLTVVDWASKLSLSSDCFGRLTRGEISTHEDFVSWI